MRLHTHLYRLLFFLLLGYGFLYFDYKWLDPTQVNTDFVSYYGMIQHPFDFHAAPSPWVYRQLTATIAHALWRAGIYYSERIQFYNPAYDQRIFFAALLTNFLSVVAAAWLVTLVIDDWLDRPSMLQPLFAGMLVFFSFFLQTTTITGQADGLSWTLMAMAYLFYRRRSTALLCLPLFLSILQREIIPVIFLVFSCTRLLTARGPARRQRQFDIRVAALSAIAFAGYLLLRHAIGAPGNEYQTDLRAQLHQLVTFRPGFAYIKQVCLTQNLVAALAGIWLLAWKRMRVTSDMLLPLGAACVALIVISIMTQIGTNASRMLALLTPILAAELAIAMASLEREAAHQCSIAR